MPTTFAGTIFDPRFCVGFVAILGPLLVSFLAFFALAGDLGASSVFDRRPKRNTSFLAMRRPRNPPKGSSEEGLKTDPKKDIKKLVFGGQFWLPFVCWATLCTVLGHFAAVFLPLGPKAFKKGGPKETNGCPRAAQGSLRETKSCQEGAKRVPESSKIDPREPLSAEKGCLLLGKYA